jgi:hypothetical protein
MKRVQALSHKNKQIILVDLSQTGPEEALPLIDEAETLVARSQPKSALILTDVTGARYNRETAAAIKNYAAHNTPYTRASAVVGVEGALNIVLQSVLILTRREIKYCKTRQEALDWLSAHG